MQDAAHPNPVGSFLAGLTDLLFTAALMLGSFKLFWGVAVRQWTLGGLEFLSAWPPVLRWVVGLPLLIAPVALGAWLLFGGKEEPEAGLLARLLSLRSSPRVEPWLTVMRGGFAVLGAFALLKLVWLTQDEAGWWSLVFELFKAF